MQVDSHSIKESQQSGDQSSEGSATRGCVLLGTCAWLLVWVVAYVTVLLRLPGSAAFPL
jgi:hypothetical protein